MLMYGLLGVKPDVYSSLCFYEEQPINMVGVFFNTNFHFGFWPRIQNTTRREKQQNGHDCLKEMVK